MNIKAVSKILLFGLLIYSSSASAVGLKSIGNVYLVNHFSTNLQFLFRQNKQYITPNNDFVLAPNASITLQVSAPSLLGEHTESYIHVATSNSKYFDFFGIRTENNLIAISGYLSSGIAFSWTHTSEPVITFCTHKAYIKNNNACP